MAADGYVLDAALLAQAGHGDGDVIALLQQLDAAQVSLIVPALAVTGATVEAAATNDQLAVIRGVGRLDAADFAGLTAFDDATDLARMRLEGDQPDELWDVQTCLQAVLRNCPILTTDAARWKSTVQALGGQLVVVEVSQLDD
ncbi:hypothetical protein [Sinosporangium siamense]|uniref:PIN domain-containing protein n=1 Tax=Sinosporangium siamense TaxID=1367973 RepID=A0A919RDH2_9ACTN|nr:hypothetical protein [Sinosporangium siamense]GII91900.1 hypothetical protein Ssi02_21310 [Sinosporangium siamense]